jgi:hypothetical protein
MNLSDPKVRGRKTMTRHWSGAPPAMSYLNRPSGTAAMSRSSGSGEATGLPAK